MTDALITNTRFGSNAEVVEWFRVVRAAYDGADTPEDFPDHLRQQAAGFDQEMVEEFLRTLADTGDPDGALAGLLAIEGQMPDLYWAYFPAEYTAEETPESDAGPFGWVDEDQAARLNAAWGGDWQTHLDPQLTARWGADWQNHPADHKQAWLTDLLPELLAPPEDPFDWVPDEQSGRLTQAWGGDWQTHLDPQLTARWGADWQSHPADHKQAWLTDLLPELLGTRDATDLNAAAATTAAGAEVSAEVAQQVTTLLDDYLNDELANLGEDSDLSEEELTELFAELQADLLNAPTTQEDPS
ncbi:hypothetical protein [Actinophytocola sp.]|uniref:hypothetical protein n=1 Tax=Actinophytocola sp. TaxID=1872138 RepID=UPI00389AEB8B